MADSSILIKDANDVTVAVDTRTEGTNANHRQVMVIADPDTNAAVAPVSAAEGMRVQPARGATATLANVAASATSVTLQAANSSRRVLIVVNDSTAILYVKYGTTASSTSFTYKLEANETLREEYYTGIVTGIWASATGNARLTEMAA